MLASSLAEISALASHQKSAKSSLAISALIDKAPSAVAKLKDMGRLVSALAKGEIWRTSSRPSPPSWPRLSLLPSVPPPVSPLVPPLLPPLRRRPCRRPCR